MVENNKYILHKNNKKIEVEKDANLEAEILDTKQVKKEETGHITGCKKCKKKYFKSNLHPECPYCKERGKNGTNN